jgi:RHS repeat-associated protein
MMHDRIISYTPFGFQGKTVGKAAFIGASREACGGYLFGNGRRLYLTSLQRFSQADPISPFDSGFNSYSYAHQDPINYHDITGLIAIPFLTKKSTARNIANFIADGFGLGTTENVQPISDVLYIFDDFTKKGKRLNISTHGTIHEGEPLIQLTKDGVTSPHVMMDIIVPQIKDLRSYASARTLICYSGDITANHQAIGQIVAQRTGLSTKSYAGPVSVHGLNFDMKNITASPGFIKKNPNGGFDFRGSHTVAKFYVPFTNNYKPVYFSP